MESKVILDWLAGTGSFFAIVILACFVCIRHHYLVHYKFKKYMSANHNEKWHLMMQERGWLPAPTWSNTYFTKAIYDFIWRSEENYGDPNIDFLRKQIRRFILELPLFVLFVFLWVFCLIMMGY